MGHLSNPVRCSCLAAVDSNASAFSKLSDGGRIAKTPSTWRPWRDLVLGPADSSNQQAVKGDIKVNMEVS